MAHEIGVYSLQWVVDVQQQHIALQAFCTQHRRKLLVVRAQEEDRPLRFIVTETIKSPWEEARRQLWQKEGELQTAGFVVEAARILFRFHDYAPVPENDETSAEYFQFRFQIPVADYKVYETLRTAAQLMKLDVHWSLLVRSGEERFLPVATLYESEDLACLWKRKYRFFELLRAFNGGVEPIKSHHEMCLLDTSY